MKVRITERPVGYISLDGHPLTVWPPVGSVVDLPEVAAEGLIAGGNAEKVVGGAPGEWLWPCRRKHPKPSGPTDLKVRIKVRPVGYVSIRGGPLSLWPKVGEVIDLPEIVARDLIASDRAEELTVAVTDVDEVAR